MPKKTKAAVAPTIAQLGKDLAKLDCDHLVGRKVLEQQIVDLARGKMDASYCQNWDRCENGWGKCTPDSRRWMEEIRKVGLDKVLTVAEREVLAKLKIDAKVR